MALASLRPSSKGVTALIIIAVMLLFGCALAYLAAAGRLRSAAAELDKKQKEVRESQKMVQKLEQSRLDYLDSLSQVRNLESSVSTQAYVPTLLKQIERLGKTTNLKVVGVRPKASDKPTERKLSSGKAASEGNLEAASEQKDNSGAAKVAQKPTTPYDEIKVELQVQGRYMNALDFLYRLTSFPKIIAVNTVEMSPASRTGQSIGSPHLDIKMEITAFVLKEGDKPESRPKPADADKSAKTSNRERRGTSES